MIVVSSGLQTLVVGAFSCKPKGLASLFPASSKVDAFDCFDTGET
jgi:hypothetical protein